MIWKAVCKEAAEVDMAGEPPAKKKVQTAWDKSEEEMDEIKTPKSGNSKVGLMGETNTQWAPWWLWKPICYTTANWLWQEKPSKKEVADVIAGVALAIVKAINNPPKEKSPTKGQGLSPLKAVSIHRSCLDDLNKAKELFEDGVLTEEEFRKGKEYILSTSGA